MFVHVKLLNGCPGLFTYKIAQEDIDKKNIFVGSLVRVPLASRTELGVIKSFQENLAVEPSYKIKSIISGQLLPHDSFYIKFIQKLAAYYCLTDYDLLKRLRSFLQEKKTDKKVENIVTSYNLSSPYIDLTPEQKSVVQLVYKNIKEKLYFPLLLHGVTGSGKTEVYKKLIEKNYNLKQTTILLLPEVSLAVQFTQILKKQLPHLENIIYGFHSASAAKEKRSLWQNLLQNKPLLIIGVHLPILLPIANLGLIIVDEEHEPGFQEKKHPKINTKEAALIRAQIHSIPILLGSATPAISSLHQVEKKNWHMAELTKRFAGKFPKVRLVNLKIKNKRKNFWISKELESEIHECLERKEQAIIFLNRRGYSFFIQCKECGHIFNCNICSVSLTLHDTGLIKCHYCNYSIQQPKTCESCNANENSLLKKGLGTQQLVSIMQKMFPNTVIARADLDTTVNKKKWREIIENFTNGKINILVGTQTITKGYHFSNVSLIGIVWADINLGLPIYTAGEITLQQLIQVSGRAGRQLEKSQVIVQTMINNDIYEYIEESNYKNFYLTEIKKREITGYPPCTRLAEIELKNSKEKTAEEESEALAQLLSDIISREKLEVTLLGPTQPPVYKIKNTFIRKIYLKSSKMGNLIKLFKCIPKKEFSSSIFFTPNPLSI